MGGLSIWHWMIVLVVVLLLFGTGKVSTLMGDFAKGIKAFKKNMAEDSDVSAEASAERPAGSIAAPGVTAAAPVRETTTVHPG
jgi:sec-independent protein translocase protein TatA